jgi:hypothetical protein
MHEVWPEGLYEPLQQVIDIARLAASLQPDGTGMPEVRTMYDHFMLCTFGLQLSALFLLLVTVWVLL